MKGYFLLLLKEISLLKLQYPDPLLTIPLNSVMLPGTQCGSENAQDARTGARVLHLPCTGASDQAVRATCGSGSDCNAQHQLRALQQQLSGLGFHYNATAAFPQPFPQKHKANSFLRIIISGNSLVAALFLESSEFLLKGFPQFAEGSLLVLRYLHWPWGHSARLRVIMALLAWQGLFASPKALYCISFECCNLVVFLRIVFFPHPCYFPCNVTSVAVGE